MISFLLPLSFDILFLLYFKDIFWDKQAKLKELECSFDEAKVVDVLHFSVRITLIATEGIFLIWKESLNQPKA